VVRLTNLPPSCVIVMKSGNLNFLEPSGPLQACNGTALPLPVPYCFCWRLYRSQEHSKKLSEGKIPIMPSGIEPATFRLVAQLFNELRHRVPLPPHGFYKCVQKNPEIKTNGASVQLFVCSAIQIRSLISEVSPTTNEPACWFAR